MLYTVLLQQLTIIISPLALNRKRGGGRENKKEIKQTQTRYALFPNNRVKSGSQIIICYFFFFSR